jgi:hypothetical protein
METIQFGGRRVDGFGVGAAPPMTPADAARVWQGSFAPAMMGAVGAVLGATAGFTGMALVAGASHMAEDDALVVAGLGLLGGTVVGAASGAAMAAKFGQRQARAAALLAQPASG